MTRAAGALAAVIALGVWLAPGAHGAFPGANGSISFSSLAGTSGDIYTMPAGGGPWRQLTFDAADDAQSAWSPDGRRIAFRSRRDGHYEVYVMNADGSGQTRLTTTTAPMFSTQPSWSPDGARLLFRSSRDGDPEVWVMNVDGSGPQRLTDNPADDRYPGFSPDGRRIAFISDRDGDFEIYTMNADGTGIVQLTANAVVDTSPAWSPDGSRIAFASDRDGNREVYVMNADGSDQRRLTFATGEDTGTAFSPDGTRIAFTSSRDGNPEIYFMNNDGTAQTRLTSAATVEQSPDWQAVPVGQPPASPTTGDRRAPRITVTARRRQSLLRRGAVVVRVRCDETCRIVASARLRAHRRSAEKLRSVRRTLRAGRRASFRLRSTRGARRATRAALSRRRIVTARVRVIGRDDAGNRRTVRRTIRVTR